ncbi:MAG TPA: septum formation initiator family protein [Anaerolineae bacterium]|nr:septum formation initiator family protein [Anaerolineae bacterium]HOQ97946.1 septum formation initiator family protein [Anaerolineae bacterium]HPL27686.1 septum formation initiator family protein [Anaerolineae bacterium]
MGKKPWLHKMTLEQLIAVAAVAISAVFLLAFGGQIVEVYRLRTALAGADGRLAQLQAEEAALQATRTYVQSDEYAEKVAREELNKIRPGDRRTILVPRAAPEPTPTPAAAPEQAPALTSYLGEWWQVFFGE